jgi:hypothetical protein
MNEFFKWLASNPIVGNILVFTLVAAIAIFVTMYVIAFFQDREIVLWPPKIGPKPESRQLRSKINGQALPKTLTPVEIVDLKTQVRFLASLLQTTDELDRQTVKWIDQLFLARDKAVASNNLQKFLDTQVDKREISGGSAEGYIGCSGMKTTVLQIAPMDVKHSSSYSCAYAVLVREAYEKQKRHSHDSYLAYYLTNSDKGLRIAALESIVKA